MRSEFDGLLQFLNYLQSQGIHICIKDYVGFLSMNREFQLAFEDYLSHSHAFCMYVKSDRTLYSQCISMMNQLKKRFTGDDGVLCGICHAGVTEWVVPLFQKEKLIGSIHAGIFPADKAIVHRRLARLCDTSKRIDEAVAYRLYQQNTKPLNIDPSLLVIYLQTIANCVSLALNPAIDGDRSTQRRSETVIVQNMIIADALAYIRQHYAERIRVEDIAQFCHCSRSHLSHLFKKRIGVAIPAYINGMRIESAKDLLSGSNDSIMDIAAKVGFEDPNYFSHVFARFSGLTCCEYRRQSESYQSKQ